MATEGVGKASLGVSSNPTDGQTAERPLVGPEHVSALMLMVALGTIMSHRPWAWSTAMIVVAMAYLYVFLQFRQTTT